jgi:hypothetical protein
MPGGNNKKKHCQCQPGCNKLRTRDTRRRHYCKVLNKNEILPSESDTDASSDDSTSSDESQGLVNDRRSSSAIAVDLPSDRENDAEYSDHGANDDSDLEMDEGSDNGNYIDMPDLELPDFADGVEDPLELGDVEFGDEDIQGAMTLEEMWQELEDVLGGNMEQALHDASKLA